MTLCMKLVAGVGAGWLGLVLSVQAGTITINDGQIQQTLSDVGSSQVNSVSAGLANVASAAARAGIIVNAEDLARGCEFNGKKFSRGARVQMGKDWMECEREHDYETNGSLMWRPVGDAAAAQQKIDSGAGKIIINAD